VRRKKGREKGVHPEIDNVGTIFSECWKKRTEGIGRASYR
jgi:hypothetical protein